MAVEIRNFNNKTVNFSDKLSQPPASLMLERQTSHTMKVYEEGSFHESNNGRDTYSNNMVQQNNINKKAASKAANDNNFDHGYHSGSGRSSITPTGKGNF